jgi:hypothetical protein
MNRNELLTETIHAIALRFIAAGVTLPLSEADRNDICDQAGDDMLGDMIADKIESLSN